MVNSLSITSSPESAADAAEAFGANPGPQGIYISQSLQQRLDLIEHLVEFGRQIIVLNGASSSGKTSLLGYLAAGHGRNWYCVRISAGPTLSVASLEQLLIRELDVDEGAESVRAAIQRRVSVLTQAGKVVLLLVDDAEHLTPDVIRAIVELANTDDKGTEFRVLLAADLDQPGLLESLQREAPQHGLVHVVEIPRQTAAQVQALIEHRLSGSGFEAEDFFTNADYTRLTTNAQGLTGQVITLARQHLAEHQDGVSRSVVQGVSWLRKLALAVLAFAAIGGGAWLANRHASNSVAGGDSIPIPTSEAAKPVQLPPAVVSPATVNELPQRPTPDEGIAAVPPQESSPAASEKMPVPTAASPAAVEITDVTPPSPPPAELPRKPNAGEIAHEQSPVVEAPANPVTTLPVEPTPLLPTLAPPSRKVAAPKTTALKVEKPKLASKQEVESVAKQAHLRAAKTKKLQAKDTSTVRSPAAPANYSETWLLKQPNHGHVLQLFGVRDRAAAQRFIREHDIAARSTLMVSTLNGKPWYIVTYGYYPDRKAASEAAVTLPAPLHGTHPWVRSIGSLRAAVH